MTARTVDVELLSPSRAKQEAFVRLQREAARLAEQWQAAVSPLQLAPVLARPAVDFALRRLALAERAVGGLPDPWRSTLKELLRRQARQLRRLRSGTWPGPSQRPVRPEELPVVFGARTWQLIHADDRWKLVIPLAGRTIALPIAVPGGQARLLERLMVHGLPLEGRLYQRRGRWFFSARYLNQAPRPQPGGPAIGVDLGLVQRAVAVEAGSGRRIFLSGRQDRARQARYARIARELRSAGARRAARRMEAKLERFCLQRDREVAIGLVRFAQNFDHPLIKFEKFPSLEEPPARVPGAARAVGAMSSRDRLQARFGRIVRMTARRAEPVGIAVVAVDGRSSSTRCWVCGKTGERRGTSFACACGHRSHADLNAARNLARTAIWQETLQIVPAGYDPGRQADGTAISADRDRYKDDSGSGGSASAHAATSKNRVLASYSSKEEYPMASIVKDLGESTSKFVVGTLDNVRSYVDKTSEELSKVDVVGVTRHILDTALDGAKNVVKTAAEPSGLDSFGVVKALADGSLEATREVVNVIAEEGKKADVFGMSTRIALEGLTSLRAEVDLGLDTTKTLFNRLAPLATSAKPVTTRPPQVTRVEIDHEKPAAKGGSKSAS